MSFLMVFVLSLLFNFNIVNPRDILRTIVSDNTPKENPAPCVKPDQSHILYYDNSGQYYLSDLQGKNTTSIKLPQNTSRKMFSKYNIRISADGSKIAISDFDKSKIWIKCVFSDGFYSIPLPKSTLNRNFTVISKLSWSPDNTTLIANYEGSLITINTESKKYSFFKKNVALKNNDNTEWADDIGDVLWSNNNIIYYTAFNRKNVTLHAYDYINNNDRVIFSSTEPLALVSISPNENFLVFYQKRWKGEELDFGPYYLYNLQTSEVKELTFEEVGAYMVVWPEDNKYVINNPDEYSVVGELDAFPAYITNLKTYKKEDLNNIVATILKKNRLVSQIDFIQVQTFGTYNGKLLVSIDLRSNQVPEESNHLINAFITLDGNIEVIQNYKNAQHLLYPLRVIL